MAIFRSKKTQNTNITSLLIIVLGMGLFDFPSRICFQQDRTSSVVACCAIKGSFMSSTRVEYESWNNFYLIQPCMDSYEVWNESFEGLYLLLLQILPLVRLSLTVICVYVCII